MTFLIDIFTNTYKEIIIQTDTTQFTMAKVMLPLLLLLLSAFLLVSTIPGGISPVQDVKNNKEVQDLGRFCVEEFNRQLLQHSNGGGERLVFSEVVDALEQVVAGVKYYLKIAAWSMENREMAIYDAQVVSAPWKYETGLLLSFQRSVA